MDLLETMPVTIVVKAPNQKIGDHTVQCEMEWTVEKLKHHLSTVYPNNPKAHQQKIIYSGKLMLDHFKLKDVLRQYHPDQTTHTMHLVCSPSPSSSASSTVSTQSSTQPSTSQPTPSQSQSSASTEGLRHRNTANHSRSSSADGDMSASVPTATPQVINASTESVPVATATAPAGGVVYGDGGPVPVMMPGGPYTPEMMMMMQQLYAQQMAHYMQYYQHPAFQQMGQANPYMQLPTDTNLGAAANQQQPQQAAERPAGAQRGNQQVRMNAQGGAVMDDDDDEDGINRDWLDWVYTLSRFSVLLSIVYFYSSISRFLMVAAFFMLVYLYQGGWLRLQRRGAAVRPERRREGQQNQAPAAQEHQQQQQQQGETDSDSSGTEEEVEGNAPVAPPAPGALSIAVSFVLNFFTSLIPQQPDAVNVN